MGGKRENYLVSEPNKSGAPRPLGHLSSHQKTLAEKVKTGLMVLIEDNLSDFKGQPLGLLANQASVGPDYKHCLSWLDRFLPGQVKVLFSPQHGWEGEKQDNMIESQSFSLPDGRVVYSLYSDSREPTKESLKGLAAVIVDLQDVGTRVYTFAQTLNLMLKVASEISLEVVVLDRPNPIGGLEIEGSVLAPEYRSFVGLMPIAMRHGLTIGELALMMAKSLEKPVKLTVIPMKGWRRDMYFNDTMLPWVWPSPNMPTAQTCLLYPGQVIWEGTNLSEGRGTTRPFHLVGAPYLDAHILAKELLKFNLPSVAFRPCHFQPSFNKWAGQDCAGVEIYPLDRTFKPFLTSLSILEVILRCFGKDFKLKDPPYEYEFQRRPIDLILGQRDIFDSLLKGRSALEISLDWQGELKNFKKERESLLIY